MAQSLSVFISSVSQGVTLRAVGFSYAKQERNQLLAGYQGVERWVTKNDYRISIGYTYAEPSKYHAKLAKYLSRNSQKNLLNTCRLTSRKRPFLFHVYYVSCHVKRQFRKKIFYFSLRNFRLWYNQEMR